MGHRWAAGMVTAATVAILLTSTAPALARSSDESTLFSLLNSARTEHHLAALAAKSDLDSIARAHSAEMASAGRIYHSSDLPDQVSGCWTLIGENVGVGPSVEDVHQALMASPTHRDNILGEFNEVGIGVITADDGEVYVTQTFAMRKCHTQHAKKKVRPHVRAQARRTPPPSAGRAHLRSAPSSAAATTPKTSAEQNVALLARIIDLDADRAQKNA